MSDHTGSAPPAFALLEATRSQLIDSFGEYHSSIETQIALVDRVISLTRIAALHDHLAVLRGEYRRAETPFARTAVESCIAALNGLQTEAAEAGTAAQWTTRSQERSGGSHEAFAMQPFIVTTAALLVAPALAMTGLAGSYLPFVLLRLWMVGFSVYGFVLAGHTRHWKGFWRGFYVVLLLVFAFVRGLEVEAWAVIDVASAVGVLVSSFYLRPDRRTSLGAG